MLHKELDGADFVAVLGVCVADDIGQLADEIVWIDSDDLTFLRSGEVVDIGGDARVFEEEVALPIGVGL